MGSCQSQGPETTAVVLESRRAGQGVCWRKRQGDADESQQAAVKA